MQMERHRTGRRMPCCTNWPLPGLKVALANARGEDTFFAYSSSENQTISEAFHLDNDASYASLRAIFPMAATGSVRDDVSVVTRVRVGLRLGSYGALMIDNNHGRK